MFRMSLFLTFVVVSLSAIFFVACDDNPVDPPGNNKKDTVAIPELISIEPGNGVPGDEISITGKYFGKSQGTSYVTFADVKPESSDYISWSDTLIRLTIPGQALTGFVKVVVVYTDTTVMSEGIHFSISSQVQPPYISVIKPNKAYAGDTVTIEGTNNFLNQRDTNYVIFHGNILDDIYYISWAGSKIIFKVPENSEPKLGKIQLVVRGVPSNEFNFTVLQKAVIKPPVIDYISPSTAKQGDTIWIYGSNFTDLRKIHNGYVVIGGDTLSDDGDFIDWKDDKILIKVPNGVQTGKLYVNKDDLKSNEVDFTLGTNEPKIPEITSFSKNDVKKSEYVDIIGKNFGPIQGLSSFLYFGGEKLPRTRITWSDKLITIKVPDDATPGTYEIYVAVDGNESNRMNITVYESQKTYLFETVLITAGTFMMGTDESDLWANPKHSVTLTRDFYMSKYEVTQFIYQDVVDTWTDPLPDDKGPQKPSNVTNWLNIVKFCNDASKKDGFQQCYTINGENVTCDFSKNGYRLPTEAEWEYACRAGTTGDLNFSTGNIEDYAWIRTNTDKLNEVGQKLPNAWGLYDMYGNAAEWVWDWLEEFDGSSETDPTGPSSFTGNGKVLKGGSMLSTTDEIKSWSRNDLHPDSQNREVGFRVVRNK